MESEYEFWGYSTAPETFEELARRISSAPPADAETPTTIPSTEADNATKEKTGRGR